jgi:homocysteine S-methyltransferase
MSQGAPVLLDGAMATELAERGFELRPPLFSARALLDAPEVIEQIHLEYLRAGAQVLRSNSFGLHTSTLAQAGLAHRQAELLRTAVALPDAVRRRERARVRIAGSIPPRPRANRSDPPELVRAEYRMYAELLVEAGADLILLETFTHVDEARLALEGLADISSPVWLAVVAGVPVPGSRRPDGTRLLGGEDFALLGDMLRGEKTIRRPDVVLLNCAQIDAVPAALDAMLAEIDPEIPLGLYPHLGKHRYDGVWIDRIVEPDVFAEQILAWMHNRARFVVAGACCGSRPAYIEALRRWLQPDASDRAQAFVRLAQLIP